MKKILLLGTMLIATICAMAAELTVYYVDSKGWEEVNAYAWEPQPNNNWPGSPATKTDLTAKGYTVFSFVVDTDKETKIIFNGGGKQTGDLIIDPAKPYCYEETWYASLEEIEGAGEYVPTYDMYIRGENVGGWGLKDEFKFATTDEEYYVIEFAEPMELTGTFKLASTKWEDYEFPNYIYGGAEEGVIVGEGETTLTQGNGSKNLTFADGLLVSKIEFVRSTGVITITVATATDLEDVDAEDAIIAAYDITGKPVAADAAGIVILQYASGKAVKVFNN